MIIKNSNLRQMLFSNRYKILGTIIAIILVLYIIQMLNQQSKEKLEKKAQNAINTQVVKETYKPEETIVVGDNVTKEQQTTNSELIDKFISYCNNKEIQKAYNLLTDECKEAVYSSKIENFQNNYVNRIFSTKKSYTIQSWISSNIYTYEVQISDDILSTGKLDVNKIEEYYTVVKKNGEYKLNIGGYIYKDNINKYAQKDDIRIDVLNKDIYKEYENYKLRITNNTQKTIMLDTRQDTNSVYLQGTNNKPYSAFMYEIEQTRLIVKPGFSITLNIRFNKRYSNNTRMEKMVFTDIVKDYDLYNQLQDKKEYKEKIQLQIEI